MPLFLLTAFDYVNSHELEETEHCDKFSTKRVLKAAGGPQSGGELTYASQSCLLSIIHGRVQELVSQGTGWLIALHFNKSHTEDTWL